MSETGEGAGLDAGVRPRVGVSSCLLGEPVRFNGGHSRCGFLAEELDPYVDWVPYCPEMEIGLGTFQGAMSMRASRGRNANALHHAFSRISREVGARRRSDLVARIESYRRGADPLSVPIAILAHYASDGELPWLAGQTYLEPFPAALRLRHNVPR